MYATVRHARRLAVAFLAVGVAALFLAAPQGESADKKGPSIPDTVRKGVDALKKSEKDLAIKPEFLAVTDKALVTAKEEIEKIQKEKVADVFLDLSKAADALVDLQALREKEKDPYWKANYDYTLARLYARMTQVLEYNVMLAKIRRDDMPELDAKIHKGWQLAPSDKFNDRDARDWNMKAQELFKKLNQEHLGTAWELVVHKDVSTPLGFTWVPLLK